jgi:tRNA-specific 2-thiouridylase
MNVYVGMSGGVDSSLTAALLKEQGHEVTGVYMKNWTQDLPGMKCPWADDLADAKRVAVQLGIDFKVFDFQKEYKQKVVDYMIAEYTAGRTPNPDIMCNQEVKFKLFLEAAVEDGAEMIATGHYARVSHSKLLNHAPLHQDRHVVPVQRSELFLRTESGLDGAAHDSLFGDSEPALLMAKDENKDQTYFLYRITEKALEKTLFPLGNFTKPEVRAMAKERGLVTAGKKDSQGICFVGKVGIREFLSQYVEVVPGEIIDKLTGKVLGYHDGAIFYTIGQRHGLDVGGGLPYYVVGKDMDKNQVFVSTNLNDDSLWRSQLILGDIHWINDAPRIDGIKEYKVRLRHRAPLISAILKQEGDDLKVVLSEPERAITPGQSAVVYDEGQVVGGGIVSSSL